MSTPKIKRRWPWIIVAAFAAYLLLLLLLVSVESTNPDASIQTFADALWYSLVTLSTVGYGDLYPTTGFGRILGILFVLMSTGLLTFLIGAVATVLFSRIIPGLRIWLRRDKNWYVFPILSPEAAALAQNLLNEDPQSIVLFPDQDHSLPAEDDRCILYTGNLAQLLRQKSKITGKCSLFYLGEDGHRNENDARQALQFGYDVYCQCESEPDSLPGKLHLFNSFPCCARLYWKRYPAKPEDCVILIGSGKHAQALLESGLQVNIRHPKQGIAYHVFGDWSNFRRNHPRLGTAVSINDADAIGDRICFHEEPWNESEALLMQAERIVLCDDEEAENLEIFRQLHHSFPVPGAVHIRADRQMCDGTVFGTKEQLFTPELVMGQQLNRTAIIMNEIYRRSTGNTAPGWEELSEFLRQSNIAAADHLLTKIRLLLQDDSVSEITPQVCAQAYAVYQQQKPEKATIFREIEHLRWVRFHVLHNWRYAPVRNNRRREHTMIIPFENLSHTEQIKDDFAWEILADLAKEPE